MWFCVAPCGTASLCHYRISCLGHPDTKNATDKKHPSNLRMSVAYIMQSQNVVTSKWKNVADLLNQMVESKARVMLGFTSMDMQKLWNTSVRIWWFPREHSYHMAPQVRLLHRCMSKKPQVVLQLSASHCLCRLDHTGQQCDGEKMYFRDESWLELDIGIASLGNWDDKAAVWRHSVEAIFHL